MNKAKAGDPASQVAVGQEYAAGVMVEQDLKRAAHWYRKAAEQGNVAGEVHLAEFYRDGPRIDAR